MNNQYNRLFIALTLLTFAFCLQSCNEQSVQVDKESVRFTVTSLGENNDRLDLPGNARAVVSIRSASGSSILDDQEISVMRTGDVYMTEPIELTPGSYSITDFIIIQDSIELFVAPKQGAELTRSSTDALPYTFSTSENRANVKMSVTDVRNQDLRKFGYTSKTKSNTVSIAAYTRKGDHLALTPAKAELRQGNKLLSTFSLTAAINTMTLGGDPKLPYSITVYISNAAKTQIFDATKIKHHKGECALKLVLEPALILNIHSAVAPGNEYEEYFNFRMEGQGQVNINWGDGEQSVSTLPLELAHEYIEGDYTAIITGNLNKVTDFYGFSYESIITAITGLTNLPALKTYNPSWGAVPIKVDLRNCKKLETINISKYGAPYETADLRTDFKLPTQHSINFFILDAPTFDISREYISSEELDVMVTNIYNNAVARRIYDGKFFVNPVVTPSASAQQKLDTLVTKYHWQVAFNDDIYNSEGRASANKRSNANGSREQWLRERFSNAEQIIQRAPAVSAMK